MFIHMGGLLIDKNTTIRVCVMVVIGRIVDKTCIEGRNGRPTQPKMNTINLASK